MRFLIILLVSTLSIVAQSGEEIFNRKCSSCHCNRPDRDESIFADEVIENFKTMPSIKISEDKAEKLTPYLFNFGQKIIDSHSVKHYSYKEALKRGEFLKN